MGDDEELWQIRLQQHKSKNEGQIRSFRRDKISGHIADDGSVPDDVPVFPMPQKDQGSPFRGKGEDGSLRLFPDPERAGAGLDYAGSDGDLLRIWNAILLSLCY